MKCAPLPNAGVREHALHRTAAVSNERPHVSVAEVMATRPVKTDTPLHLYTFTKGMTADSQELRDRNRPNAHKMQHSMSTTAGISVAEESDGPIEAGMTNRKYSGERAQFPSLKCDGPIEARALRRT